MLEAAIFLVSIGLFLIVSRRNALMQVIGYLVIENGIFVFAVITVAETPLLVELGILLDAFVAVFVMGIAVFHINREFGIDRCRSAHHVEGLTRVCRAGTRSSRCSPLAVVGAGFMPRAARGRAAILAHDCRRLGGRTGVRGRSVGRACLAARAS